MNKLSFDILIVGGGISGTVGAWAFHKAGFRVGLVDLRKEPAKIFRAERVSNTSAGILTSLGLEDRLQGAVPLDSTGSFIGEKVEHVSNARDYSIPLWQLIEELRRDIESTQGIELLVDCAESAEISPDRQKVLLRSGKEVDCKLLVVATGSTNGFLKALGIDREILSENHSSTFGFDIEPEEGFKLPHHSVSLEIFKDGVDYMNVFPTPDGGYRANLFTYWPAGSRRIRDFIKGDPTGFIRKIAPKLMHATGRWKVKGKIQCGTVSISKSTGYRQPGVVLVGDAYGRVCPCAGMGVTKALSDILSVQKLLPDWVGKNLSLTREKISEYYDDPERRAYEDELYNNSMFIRNRLMSKSPEWVLRRMYHKHVPLRVKDLLVRLRSRKASAATKIQRNYTSDQKLARK